MNTSELPLEQEFRLVESRAGQHVFVVDGSRLYDLDPASAARVGALLTDPAPPELEARRLRERFRASDGRRFISDVAPETPALRSLSLNIAQGCNLGCGYCYADEGRFGGARRDMGSEVARRAVDQLIAESEPGVDLVVGFMGGEPLLQRRLLHDTTRYAVRRGRESGHPIGFSLTTNATLITEADAALFAEHDFGVSVSLDGPRELNDTLRPTRGGGSSYDAFLAGLEHLLATRPKRLSARITVTPRSGRLLPLLRHALDLGVDDAGFAPVLVSPDPAHAFEPGDFAAFLEHMIECGDATREALLERRRFPFSNFETALHELHRGSHRPYPCGAGAGYLSVSAEGELFACHRLVDDDAFGMGDVFRGSDVVARSAHLERRHVDAITPCRSCWARYLCGGGCYHEVERRGRIGCDYIRGWLDHCLAAYAELSSAIPRYFSDPEAHFGHDTQARRTASNTEQPA